MDPRLDPGFNQSPAPPLDKSPQTQAQADVSRTQRPVLSPVRPGIVLLLCVATQLSHPQLHRQQLASQRGRLGKAYLVPIPTGRMVLHPGHPRVDHHDLLH